MNDEVSKTGSASSKNTSKNSGVGKMGGKSLLNPHKALTFR